MPELRLPGIFSGLVCLLKRKRNSRNHQATLLLSDLPIDIILEVFLHLDFADVLALAKTSHLFYDISQSLVVWKSLACKLMCRGRRISLFDNFSITALTAVQLKQSVILAIAAEDSWLGPNPVHVTCPRPVRLSGIDLDHASYIMKFTSQRHLVLPTKGGELVGWDTHVGSCAGRYEMGADSVLINVQGVFATRSLYWITGRISSDTEQDQNLHIEILRIQFPEPSSSEPVTFEVLGNLITPWSLAAELHFLDASQRMFCAVFFIEETGTAGLHVVLDWESGLSYMFDTGIAYEYGRAVIGLHLSVDKKSIIVRTEQCGAEIRRAYSLKEMRSRAFAWNTARRPLGILPMVHPSSSALFRWEHEHHALGFDMTPHTVWVLPQWWPAFPGVPRRTSTIILYLSVLEDESGETKRFWRAAQHYSESVETATEGGGEIDEKYTAPSVWGCEGEMDDGAPCSSARSVVDIGSNAVTISLGQHGLPILAQSFNHLGWIEEIGEGNVDEGGPRERRRHHEITRPRRFLTDVQWRSSSFLRRSFRNRQRPRRTRVLKLVTFPDPGISPVSPKCKLNRSKRSRRRSDRSCNCTTLQSVTLDVPSSLLENVYHMFLDPAAGTVTLATGDNELHVFQYGIPDSSTPDCESIPTEAERCTPLFSFGASSAPVVSV